MIPLKAIVLNLLSVGAAYGVLVLVFQNGWLEGAARLRVDRRDLAWLPLFLFVVLFGLSMDYHVFILSRIRELYDGGHDDRRRGPARGSGDGRRGDERGDRDGRGVRDLRDACACHDSSRWASASRWRS